MAGRAQVIASIEVVVVAVTAVFDRCEIYRGGMQLAGYAVSESLIQAGQTANVAGLTGPSRRVWEKTVATHTDRARASGIALTQSTVCTTSTLCAR